MDDVGVRDRQDDPEAFAPARVEFRLQIDHVGCPVGSLLGVHAVIGGDPHHSSEREQLSDLRVDACVEREGLWCIRHVLVLHEIGGAEVEEIGSAGLE